MDVNFRDFEFHENEEVTYDAVSRVFNAIYDLQVAIINTITAGENIDNIAVGDNDVAISSNNVNNITPSNTY